MLLTILPHMDPLGLRKVPAIDIVETPALQNP